MSRRTNHPRLQHFVLAGLLVGCGGGGEPADVPSSGLKIFVTTRQHNGNFRDDPTLAGSTAVAKADSFCQADPARPSSAVYKALFVDGVSRDAVSRTDWVLRPSTAYYRPLNNIRIGVTSADAVFPTETRPLENIVHESFGVGAPSNPNANSNVWTGLADASVFASSAENCQGWSTTSDFYAATYGNTTFLDAAAFHVTGTTTCSAPYRLYCVEQ